MKTYSATDYAMYYLTSVPKTEKQMRVKLLEKGYAEAEIDKTIEFLKLKKFINDAQYVRMFLEDQVVHKGKPLYVSKGKLIQKGVPKHIIEQEAQAMQDEIHQGILQGIQKEIDKLKKKSLS